MIVKFPGSASRRVFVGRKNGTPEERAARAAASAAIVELPRNSTGDGVAAGIGKMNDTALSKRAYDGLKAATEIMLEQPIDDEHWQPAPAAISQFGIPRLLCLPNVGRKTIEEIKDWLAAYRRALEDEQRQAI
jgi:hypothetical protein